MSAAETSELKTAFGLLEAVARSRHYVREAENFCEAVHRSGVLRTGRIEDASELLEQIDHFARSSDKSALPLSGHAGVHCGLEGPRCLPEEPNHFGRNATGFLRHSLASPGQLAQRAKELIADGNHPLVS